MNTLTKGLFLCILVISVAACGGSGSGISGGGNDQSSSARINSANAKQLGTAATEGLKQATLNNTSSALGFRPGARGIGSAGQQLLEDLSGRIAQIPVPGLNCGLGSAEQTDNSDGSKTIVFSNCDLFGFGLLEFDGTVVASSSIAGDTTTINIEYSNFTIDDGTNVVTIDMNASCMTNSTTMETSCTFSDVVGFDGRTYVFSDSTISGDASMGYTISATITDPDHGNFSILTTAPILFGCANGQPSSGQIQFTDGAGVSVTVTFNDCTSFTVFYNGTSEVYLW